ncbi:MAG: hypothetical protein V7K36_25320 [Nostoc sp.]
MLITVICFVFVGAGDNIAFSTKTEVALIGSELMTPDISQEEANTAVVAQILISMVSCQAFGTYSSNLTCFPGQRYLWLDKDEIAFRNLVDLDSDLRHRAAQSKHRSTNSTRLWEANHRQKYTWSKLNLSN